MVGKEQNKIMSESLENFTNIVKEDIKEAKTLFFSEAFKEEYLKDRREEKELYHQLLLGRNQESDLGGIFAEFRTEKAGSLECSKDDLSGNDHES